MGHPVGVSVSPETEFNPYPAIRRRHGYWRSRCRRQRAKER